MKILRVMPTVDGRAGGVVEAVFQLQKDLKLAGHQVSIVCLDRPEDEWVISRKDNDIYALGTSSSHYGFSLRLIKWLKNNAHRYDCAIIEGIWQFHSIAAWYVCKRMSLPYFVFTHGMLDPWFKKTYPIKHVKKWCYWNLLEHRVLQDARSVFFTCDEERRRARKSFRRYQCSEIVVGMGSKNNPYPKEVVRAAFYTQFPQIKDKKYILFLSRIHEKKGCDLLIEAFASVSTPARDIFLVLAGPGDNNYINKLKAMANELGVSNKIIWVGMLQGKEKWGAFECAEVFCLPSHQENFGIVVAESLSSSLPVIISDKVNIWREIEFDEAGIICCDSADDLATSLRKWFNFDSDEKHRAGKLANDCYSKRYRPEVVSRKLISALEDALSAVGKA